MIYNKPFRFCSRFRVLRKHCHVIHIVWFILFLSLFQFYFAPCPKIQIGRLSRKCIWKSSNGTGNSPFSYGILLWNSLEVGNPNSIRVLLALWHFEGNTTEYLYWFPKYSDMEVPLNKLLSVENVPMLLLEGNINKNISGLLQ